MTARHAAPVAIAVEPLLLPPGFTQDPEGGRPLPYGPHAAAAQRAADELAGLADADPQAGDVAGPAAGLFAAADRQLPVGQYDPAPTVIVAGTRLATSAPPNGDLTGLVVLDDLRVPWGTSETVEQSPPAEASFSLIDFSRTWATRQDVIGLPVALGYAFPAGFTADGVDDGTFFRGRISDVALAFTRVRRPDGSHQLATRVEVKCSSIETDLGNRRPAEANWPAETITARAARIAGYCTGVASSVTARVGDWGAAQAAADAVGTTSVKDLLTQLYNSTGGDRMVFRPSTPTTEELGDSRGRVAAISGAGVYEHLGRRTDSTRSQCRLTWGTSTHPRYNQGAWIATASRGRLTGVTIADPGTALYLDAGVLEYDTTVQRGMSSRISRSSVTSKDSGASDARRTVTRVTPGIDESVSGQRAVTLDSLHNWNDWANLNAEDLLAMATQEGALWSPGRVRWDVRKSGGFDLISTARALLLGHVSGYRWFVGRAQVTQLGIRPMFSIIGGVIGYRRGGWVLDLDLAGWATFGGGNSSPTYVPQHAATWEELAGDGSTTFGVLTWGTGADPGPTNFHATVTYEDLAHVGLGLGATVVGPDKGYDK